MKVLTVAEEIEFLNANASSDEEIYMFDTIVGAVTSTRVLLLDNSIATDNGEYHFDQNGRVLFPSGKVGLRHLWFINNQGKPDFNRPETIEYENGDVCSFNIEFSTRQVIGKYNEKCKCFEVSTAEFIYEYKLHNINNIKYIGKL